MQIIMQKLIEKMKAVSYKLSVVSIQYSVVSYFCDEKGSWRPAYTARD